jgi:thioredoxin 1
MRPAEFFKSLVDGEKTLLHFSADWCQPCKLMQPVIDDLLVEKDNMRYVYINVDADINKEIVDEFAVKSVPTLVSFDGKRKINTKRGAQTKSQLEGMWELYD